MADLIFSMDKILSAFYNAFYKAESLLHSNCFEGNRKMNPAFSAAGNAFLNSCCISRGKIQGMEEEQLKEKIFVICDIQKQYAERLFPVLRKGLDGKYQFHLFFDLQKMINFAEYTEIDVLITGEEIEKQIPSDLRIIKHLVLTGIPDHEGKNRSGMIFRYQSSERILSEIRKICEKRSYVQDVKLRNISSGEISFGSGITKKENRIRDEPEETSIIAVYSPIHRIGKTKFSIRLGKKLSEKQTVLYLNMEGFSGGELYFPDTGGQDLGDLIYCIRQERGDYGLKISSMAGQIDGMDFIMPVKNENDIRSVTFSQWSDMLDKIKKQCIYEVIILDLGDCINGLYEILRKCSRIYTPYINESAAEAKMKQYEENLKQSGFSDILSKTVKKEMRKAKVRVERNVTAE